LSKEERKSEEDHCKSSISEKNVIKSKSGVPKVSSTLFYKNDDSLDYTLMTPPGQCKTSNPHVRAF
jgi:hypothetical protein